MTSTLITNERPYLPEMPGMSKVNEISETSPLLASPPLLIESLDAGDASNGPLPSDVEAQGHLVANGHLGEGEDESEHGQEDNSADPNHYDGLPEVKKQFKWILPAISLGVSVFSMCKIGLAECLTMC